MRSIRRFSTAILLAGIVAGGAIVSSVQLEAAKGGTPGKPGGSVDTLCQYLASQYAALDPTSLYAQLIAAAMASLNCPS